MSRFLGMVVLICLALPLACLAGARQQEILSQLRKARTQEEAAAALSRSLGASTHDYERFIQDLAVAEILSLTPSQLAALTDGPLRTRLMAERIAKAPVAERPQLEKFLNTLKVAEAKKALQALAPYPSDIPWHPSSHEEILKLLHRISTEVRGGKYQLDKPLAEHMSVALATVAPTLVNASRDQALIYAMNEHLQLLELAREGGDQLAKAHLEAYGGRMALILGWRIDYLERHRRALAYGKGTAQQTMEYLQRNWSAAVYGGDIKSMALKDPCPYASL